MGNSPPAGAPVSYAAPPAPPIIPYAGDQERQPIYQPQGYGSDREAAGAFYGAGRMIDEFSSPLAPGSLAATVAGGMVGMPFLSPLVSGLMQISARASQRAALDHLVSTGMSEDAELDLGKRGPYKKRSAN